MSGPDSTKRKNFAEQMRVTYFLLCSVPALVFFGGLIAGRYPGRDWRHGLLCLFWMIVGTAISVLMFLAGLYLSEKDREVSHKKAWTIATVVSALPLAALVVMAVLNAFYRTGSR